MADRNENAVLERLRDAVESGWLSDYRIIALGVNDPEAYQTANRLAGQEGSRLSTVQFLRGLALALVMGGATREEQDRRVIRSSINFLNTVNKSKEMTKALSSKTVRDWVGNRLAASGVGEEPADYRLQHLDADSNVAQREQAKAQLAAATDREPRGILNVGIFGEGTDAPSTRRCPMRTGPIPKHGRTTAWLIWRAGRERRRDLPEHGPAPNALRVEGRRRCAGHTGGVA